MKRLIVVALTVIGLIFLCGGAHAEVPRDGLVAAYLFDGNANDTSWNGNHGTEFGGIDYTLGKIGQSVNFDGIDDYIHVENSSSINTSVFTTSCWTI